MNKKKAEDEKKVVLNNTLEDAKTKADILFFPKNIRGNNSSLVRTTAINPNSNLLTPPKTNPDQPLTKLFTPNITQALRGTMTPEKQIEVRERPPNFKTKEELKFGLSERKEKKKNFY